MPGSRYLWQAAMSVTCSSRNNMKTAYILHNTSKTTPDKKEVKISREGEILGFKVFVYKNSPYGYEVVDYKTGLAVNRFSLHKMRTAIEEATADLLLRGLSVYQYEEAQKRATARYGIINQ